MRSILLTAAVLLALSPALGADTPPPAAPDFPKLVKDLGDPSFQVREAASDALARAGETSRATLQEAARSTDPEVQTRARTLLDALDARRIAQARKEQDAEPPDLLQQQLLRERLEALADPGGGVHIAVSVNGKRVQLGQNDLAQLEALKGRRIQGAGITCGPCPAALADQLRIPGGVLVEEADGAAGGMDLEKHDLIVEAAGAAVTDPEALEKLLEASAGKPLALTLYRKGEKRQVTVTPPKP